jgi:septal ring factor EnvC (AmiA/AmiB activator)
MSNNIVSQNPSLKALIADRDVASNGQITTQQLVDAIAQIKHQLQQSAQDIKLTQQWIQRVQAEQKPVESTPPNTPSERQARLAQLAAKAEQAQKRAERWLSDP